jgi:nucleoside-diphosphate-sugar epimerase
MRILNFGAIGFIGRHLTHAATTQGHDVVALCRSSSIDGFHGEIIRWQFGDSLPESRIEGVDCAIHLAHDFNGLQGAQWTVRCTMECIEQISALGAKRQLFFTSYSAGGHATSLYGRSKLEIEKDLKNRTDVVIVRPGLVLGEGGIYGKIAKIARTLPIIPLPDGGRGMVPVIEIDDLCHETLVLAQSQSDSREANLFEQRFRSLRELVETEAIAAGKSPMILSIPSTWMMAGLQIIELLHLPLPVKTDNLRGFLSNQKADYTSTM